MEPTPSCGRGRKGELRVPSIVRGRSPRGGASCLAGKRRRKRKVGGARSLFYRRIDRPTLDGVFVHVPSLRAVVFTVLDS